MEELVKRLEGELIVSMAALESSHQIIKDIYGEMRTIMGELKCSSGSMQLREEVFGNVSQIAPQVVENIFKCLGEIKLKARESGGLKAGVNS